MLDRTNRSTAVAVTIALLVSIPLMVRAQSSPRDRAAARELSRGVRYWSTEDARGPWRSHIVEIDLTRGAVELQPSRARDSLRGRERVSSMARRAVARGDTVLAAINADFFDLKTGENENNQVIGGTWWKGLKVTESPYDTYDNVHAQFAIDAMGRPVIDRFILDGKAWARGVMTPIIAVNAITTGAQEGTALYTARFGATTPRDTARPSMEVALREAGRVGDTVLYVRRGPPIEASGTAIPADGAVLASYGARTKEVGAMRDGDTVRVLLATLPRLRGGLTPRAIIGGWPRILQDGVNVAGDAATVEGTISRNAEARHPRTAIAFSRDGKRLWLYAVDGRTATSVGMTLVELADALRQLGAWQAMNFDGGGSTTMVIDGVVVNAPSDPTGEREVGNAVLVVKRRRP